MNEIIRRNIDDSEMRTGVYDINHIYALRLETTNESDLRSYEATKAVAKKAQKKIMRLQRDSNP